LFVRKIRSLRDVVDWRLCVGCGACAYVCDKNLITLEDVENAGIRPRIAPEGCGDCDDCLDICPGVVVHGRGDGENRVDQSDMIGPAVAVWEGSAANREIQHAASSGGCLTALALYCLEKEGMGSVIHTGMNPETPWTNRTVQSGSREEILSNSGSRYAPSSPCEALDLIEKSDRPCVFIGKPCDVAAVSALRRSRPALDRNLGLVLTFFCAGAPSTFGTLELLKELGVPREGIDDIRYRGRGWPGNFRARFNARSEERSVTYMEAWSRLQAYRPFRCHLCPDGLGETADISCGDAWHRYPLEGHDGLSLILARSGRGADLIEKAREAGYVTFEESSPADVIKAQGILERRRELHGRQQAMRMLLVPAPRFENFPLAGLWKGLPLKKKFKTIAGTLRRLIMRGQWRRNVDSAGH
jgi:coenzyme F420 hydrogenase subunit beta